MTEPIADLPAALRALADEAAAWEISQRGQYIVCQAGLRGSRGALHDTFSEAGLTDAGSRLRDGALVVYLAGPIGALLELARLLERRPAQARAITFVRFEPVEDIIKVDPTDPGEHLEAVLHAAADDSPEVLADHFGARVAQAGGTINRTYARAIGGLVFVPVRLPAASAHELAHFNPLRLLRTAARIALRAER